MVNKKGSKNATLFILPKQKLEAGLKVTALRSGDNTINWVIYLASFIV
jgi:hypothetical protein